MEVIPIIHVLISLCGVLWILYNHQPKVINETEKSAVKILTADRPERDSEDTYRMQITMGDVYIPKPYCMWMDASSNVGWIKEPVTGCPLNDKACANKWGTYYMEYYNRQSLTRLFLFDNGNEMRKCFRSKIIGMYIQHTPQLLFPSIGPMQLIKM